MLPAFPNACFPRCSPVQVLKRPPYSLLEGDLVRAEYRVLAAQPRALHPSPSPPAPTGSGDAAAGCGAQGDEGHRPSDQQPQHGQWRLARKEEPLAPHNCVLLLLTNRRTAWQAAARQHQPH